MTKMIKLVNNNFKTAIINMLEDLKEKHNLMKRETKYFYIYKTQIELEYNIQNKKFIG